MSRGRTSKGECVSSFSTSLHVTGSQMPSRGEESRRLTDVLDKTAAAVKASLLLATSHSYAGPDHLGATLSAQPAHCYVGETLPALAFQKQSRQALIESSIHERAKRPDPASLTRLRRALTGTSVPLEHASVDVFPGYSIG